LHVILLVYIYIQSFGEKAVKEDWLKAIDLRLHSSIGALYVGKDTSSLFGSQMFWRS